MKLNIIKTLLFDFGGTLDIDGIHWSEKFYEAYKYAQVDISRELLREAFVHSERVISNIIKPDFDLRMTLFQQIYNQIEFMKEINALNSNINFLTEEILDYCYSAVIENVKTSKILLEYFCSKYQLGLISNYYGNVETVLDELDLKKYFSTIVDSAVVGFRKPNKEIFKLAISKLNAEADETFMIGDSYKNDIVPSKLIGCSTIWINNKGWDTENEINDADFIIKTITELHEVLKK